jgi:uncharacterized protein with von Willebrand factor type A (vWA) domain
MSGESQREREINRLISDIQSAKASNPLLNFSPEFSTQDLLKNLDKLIGQYQTSLTRQAGENLNRGVSNITQSLASQGITRGSLLSAQQRNVASDVQKNLFNALENLFSSATKQRGDIMQSQNQFGLSTAAAKNQALAQLLGLQASAAGAANPSTWLDDLFAGITAVGNLIGGIRGK